MQSLEESDVLLDLRRGYEAGHIDENSVSRAGRQACGSSILLAGFVHAHVADQI